MGRLARLAGHGLWDFLIGDTPGFALAAGALVVFAVLLHHERLAVVVGLPALVVVALSTGVWHGRRRSLRQQRLSSTATKASSGSPVNTSDQAQPVPSTSERSSRSDTKSHENHADATWR